MSTSIPFRSATAIMATAFLASVLWGATAHAQSPFRTGSGGAGRSLDSALPNEAVDPLAGTLSIVETDLALPGNAGLGLAVQRVYNSAIYPGYNANDLTIEEDSWAGIGWKLHFGRVINPNATTGGATQIEMGDGSRHALYTTSVSPGWTTKGFWLYDRSTHTLKLPGGVIYEFGHVVTLGGTLGTVRYVTVIRDQFNNRLEFTYFSSPGPPDGVSLARQILGGGQVRDVTFAYDPTLKALSSMAYDGKTWTYTQQANGPAGYSTLERVQTPVGLAVEYDYTTAGGGNPGLELNVLRFPAGGTVTYVYGDVISQTGATTNKGRGVLTKTLGGTQVTPGTWTYTYNTGPNHDSTRIECPCGTTTYRFNGIGNSGNFSGWLAGTVAERTVEQQGVLLHTETQTWLRSEPISPDPISGSGGLWGDAAVYGALPEVRTVTRGTKTWTTANEYHTSNFNDYLRPWRTTEQGELFRTTTRTFQSGFTPYVLPQVNHVEVGPTGFERNFTFDTATGLLVSETTGPYVSGGPTYSYEAWPSGNPKAVIDPRGNRTDFQYAWGVVSRVAPPAPQAFTESSVSPNGTIAWTETDGKRTEFVYDAAFRLTTVKPSGGRTWITYAYDNVGGSWVTEQRSPASVTTSADGFGRVVGTVDHTGVKSGSGRDACGRVIFQSYAYTTGAGTTGVTTTYDALHRPLTVTAATVGSSTTAVTQYAYTTPGTVIVTDPRGRATTYEYSAYGDPDGGHLTLVKDADNKFTRYTYDKFGNLIIVNGPNASGLAGSLPQRTWSYDGRNFLQSDTQPEKGTTTYARDAAGNVTQVDDGAGTITFTYDGLNRLATRNATGTSDDLEVTYTPTGQVEIMASPTILGATAKTTFGYFPTTDLVSWRTDLVNGHTFGSSYTYTLDDKVATLTYPSGRVVEHTYHAGTGRLSSVKYNGSVFANGFTFDDAGRLSGYNTGPVSHTVRYDGRQRLDRVTSGTQPSGLDLVYRFNDANEIERIDDTRNGSTQLQTFDYDAVGRLWAADGPWGNLRWSYDPAGNRKTETRGSQTTYTYDEPTQRLSSTSGGVTESFAYDAVGRVITDGRGGYTYNARGLLATATNGISGLSASYAYDPAGLRSLRTVNSQATYTVRSAGDVLLSEFTSPCGGAPAWSRDVVYAGGRLLGAVRANTTPPTATMNAAAATVPEAQTSMTVGIKLSTSNGAPTTCPVTVSYETVAGTATVGADFTSTGGTLTFPAGTASNTVLNVTVPLSSSPDTVNEPNETFTVLLSGVSGGTLYAPAGTTVTILDDDIAPAMAIEQPLPGSVRTPVTISGWAIDESVATGTGIDLIHVYKTPAGGSAQYMGPATYGLSRPDIAALYGDPRFTNSGYSFVAQLAPGAYTLTVYAFRGGSGPLQSRTVDVTVAAANPQMSLELPSQPGSTLAQPVTVSGWAVDLGTSTGTGVSSVQVLAYPNPGSNAPPIVVGNATYGGARSDVQQAYAAYGSGFAPSGFTMQVRGLAPGTYALRAQALSTVTQTYNQYREITVTVTANPVGWIDVPAPSSVQGQSVTVGGWAVDLAAGSGTGVSTVHLWVLPNPGSGQPAQPFGVATYGGARPDVGSYYGSQFTNSGYSFTGTLAPGTYQLQVFAWSTVLNTWATAQTTTFTVQ